MQRVIPIEHFDCILPDVVQTSNHLHIQVGGRSSNLMRISISGRPDYMPNTYKL